MNRRTFLQHIATFMMAGSPPTSWCRNENLSQMTNKTTGFVYDDISVRHSLGKTHPESPQRFLKIMEKMQQSGLLSKLTAISPNIDVFPHLYMIHTKQHIQSVKAHYKLSHEVALQAVSAALTAVNEVCSGALRNAFCAVRPPGHHALNTGREEGFCFYNTIAVAARYAQKVFALEKILIVDWDYHHGNGTEAAFYADPSVLFFSTHDQYNYPGTGDPTRIGSGHGQGFNINVHLQCGATDTDIIDAFEQHLLPRVVVFKPDMILISAGFDGRIDDPLGCFDITDKGFSQLTSMMMTLADEYCAGRIVSLLEGGYNLDGLAMAVYAHVSSLSGFDAESQSLI